MTQRYRIVNITRGEVLEPSLFGSPNVFSGFYNHFATMGAFVDLLSSSWSGDRVIIIGDTATDDDLPNSWMMAGVPASEFYEATKRHRDYTPVDYEMRKHLAQHYRYDFTISETSMTRLAFGGQVTTSDINVYAARPEDSSIAEVLRSDTDPVVVMNLDTRQYLRPETLGHGADAGLAALVLNPANTDNRRTDPGLGLLPTALAFLLNPSLESNSRLEGVSGEWTWGAISVVGAQTTEKTPGCTDISDQVLETMLRHPKFAPRAERMLAVR